MKNYKKALAVILLVIILVAGAALYISRNNSNSAPKGYRKVNSYMHVEPGQITCQALLPECGYCPGDVIEKSCYVKDTESK
jgi:endonuclease III